MPIKLSAKGKKRAVDKVAEADGEVMGVSGVEGDVAGSSSSLTPLEDAQPAKKRKRAETRTCPICEESIPIRLLGAHSTLESQRVQALMDAVGDTEVWNDPYPSSYTSGSGETVPALASTSRRRSAVKARTSMSTSASASPAPEYLLKTLRTIKKRRKQRHMQLRDLTRDLDSDDESGSKRRGKRTAAEEGQVCPVCLTMVHGDPDVVNAHVDACLVHASMQAETSAQPSITPSPSPDIDVNVDDEDDATDPWEEIVTAEGTRLRLRRSGQSAQRLGFAVRDRAAEDVDEEVDVEGDDEGVFGRTQFTEDDIVKLEAEKHDPGLEDAMVARAQKLDADVDRARASGDKDALIAALEAKMGVLPPGASTISATCRICLDSYTEPTVSTGCWHACCSNCWLRCLSATGVCPICKRITAPADLRRIYL
ncbi:hypothetical protein DENSPDRAFT_839924 [Dentipellis sp. KUC8613]|nr:hypothetical protein DENSPDRAFT_839924 [Dentipellis sp. KUC8613]